MRLYPYLFLLAGGLLAALPSLAQRRQLIVAADGSGDFRTVQAAFDAVPDGNTTPVIITIKKGTYKEKLTLAKGKNLVRLVGTDATQTMLTYDDYNQRIDPATGKNIGTSGSGSIHIYGDDFSARNITFENSAGPVGQAVAAWVSGDRASFVDCRFLGFQDTLYTYGYGSRQYYKHCYIEGTVDFIFGSSTAWFEDCTLFGKRGGFFTAASTPDTTRYGYVFRHCKLTGDAPAGSFYLGRPWRPYAKVVYLDCELGAIVKPEGWDEWGKESNKQTASYAEYKSSGPGAAPSSRAAWTHQLTAQEARIYTRDQVLRGWQPSN